MSKKVIPLLIVLLIAIGVGLAVKKSNVTAPEISGENKQYNQPAMVESQPDAVAQLDAISVSDVNSQFAPIDSDISKL